MQPLDVPQLAISNDEIRERNVDRTLELGRNVKHQLAPLWGAELLVSNLNSEVDHGGTP